jgi:hypothetical protein
MPPRAMAPAAASERMVFVMFHLRFFRTSLASAQGQ